MGKGKRLKTEKLRNGRERNPALSVAGFDLCGILADALNEKPGDRVSAGKGEAETAEAKFLRDIANQVWRLKRKMTEAGNGEPKLEFRSVYRHVEALSDALSARGVDIRDHEGERYDTGSALDVVASEPREGLKREEVVQTVKPTVRLKGVLLQRGEVVIGVPRQEMAGERTGTRDTGIDKENGYGSDNV